MVELSIDKFLSEIILGKSLPILANLYSAVGQTQAGYKHVFQLTRLWLYSNEMLFLNMHILFITRRFIHQVRSNN